MTTKTNNLKTHRCEGSLKQQLSIRFDEYTKEWKVYRHVNDWNYSTDYHYLEELMKINYCPCCGKKLD